MSAATDTADTAGGAVTLPSGLAVRFLERRDERQGGQAVVRFRYVAPGLEGLAREADLSGDMAWLCRRDALPRLRAGTMAAEHVVLSLASRAVPFGSVARDVRQVFEGYRIEDDSCVWEYF